MSDNLKQVEFARETLAVFEEHGEDMTDVRHVLHFLYGGNLEGLRAALTELGYAVTPTADDDGLIAERYEVIGESWRTSTLPGLCELADTYGAEYDGWEAEMTRQPAAQAPAPAAKAGWLAKLLGRRK